MRFLERFARTGVVSIATLLLAAGGALAAPPAAAGSDGDWPKTILLGERKVILDAPHAESLAGTVLKARGTFGLVKKGESEPTWGAIWYESDVTIDRGHRSVTLTSVRVPRVQLAGTGTVQLEKLAARLGQAITRRQIRLRLDDVLASVRTAKWLHDDTPPKLGTDPPAILFESEPAVLVVFDGEPRFHAVDGSKLERAMNTAFLVLHDSGANAYYLDGGTAWFHAPEVTGPWTQADEAPAEALKIAKHDREAGGVSEKEVGKGDEAADKRVPKILVATEPTELVVSDGPPKWSALVEGRLDAMSTSESDVFRTQPDEKVWAVLSGRWYQSDALSGPWTYVPPDRLPESFHDIPKDSKKANVLAFVPGTGPAHEALEDAATPRTAAIRRKDAHVNVTYDGEPRFEAVPGTHVEYALNTPEQVLRIRGRYYVCDQGVWFSSGASGGPWMVAEAIPEEEIQAIPPESPVYNTRFVYVYDSTPDVIYTAYTPAYLGSYPYRGSVVFGTGWAYRPWWGASYYPRPWTWGFHALYTPWVGWGFGFAWRPAWAGFRYGFGYGWGARWCGPGGFYRPAFAGATRNVNITRNVNVTRNVYNTGANQTRATVTHTAARTSSTAKTTSHPQSGKTTASHAGARSKTGAAHPGKAKSGAKAGGKGKKP